MVHSVTVVQAVGRIEAVAHARLVRDRVPVPDHERVVYFVRKTESIAAPEDWS